MLGEIDVDEIRERWRLSESLLAAELLERPLERLGRRLPGCEPAALHASRVAAAKPVPIGPATAAATLERKHLPLLDHRASR